MSTIQSSNDWTVLTSRYISFFLRLSSILFSLHFTWHRITAILWFGNVSFWARCWHLLHFSFLFALCSFSCHLYAIARATYHVASLCLCLSSPPYLTLFFEPTSSDSNSSDSTGIPSHPKYVSHTLACECHACKLTSELDSIQIRWW